MIGVRGVSGVSWLVWRQHRTALWALLATTVLVGGYLVSGALAAHTDLPGLDGCTGAAAEHSRRCSDALTTFQMRHQHPLRTALQGLLLLPLLFGLFLGGPLFAQELECGTHRTALSQSVTRTRWFLAKLAVPVTLTILFSGLITAAATWWWHTVATPLGSTFPWYGPMPFDAVGPAPTAKAVLMLLIGITLSLLVRRTVGAMGATVAVGAVVLFALEQARGALWPVAEGRVYDVGGDPAPSGAWLLDEGLLSTGGRRMADLPDCLAATDPTRCLTAHGAAGRWAEYHPSAHMWPLQWTETALCLTAAVALALFCHWWTRRRLT
ncbi:ABC transporter permease subunit [Streptomyces sp. NPDC051555]|uniref:ABC transporter permease subunit n=1 Tax=Streptomyces sp. NPDC051555 TaxID=3365657 RepID=UPI0037A30BFF